jgi:anti-anti-sigma factor
VSDLEVTEQELQPGVVRVAVRGELTLASAYTLDRRLLAVEATRPRVIVLDLGGAAMLDSAGLARLLSAHRRARRGGWRLALLLGSRPVERVLAMTRLDEHLDVVRDVASVLRPRAPAP